MFSMARKKEVEQEVKKEVKKFSWLVQGTSFTNEQVEEIIEDYIKTHKWLVNEKIPIEITFEQASDSWYELVFQPLMRSLNKTGVNKVLLKNMSLFEAFQKVSDSHLVLNIEAKGTGRYYDYEDACFHVLHTHKGYWLNRLMSLFVKK